MCPQHAERMRLYKNPLRENRYLIKHGLSKDRIYKIWGQIKDRCYNTHSFAYSSYGGRGIKLSDEFLDPKVFVEYVKKLKNYKYRTTNHLTLDRINNNKGYQRKNLRWATGFQQRHNQRLNSRNTTGYNGVYKYREKFYRVTVGTTIDGKRQHIYVGDFKTKLEAHQARIKYEKENNYA